MEKHDMETVYCAVVCLQDVIKWLFAGDSTTASMDSKIPPRPTTIKLPPCTPTPPAPGPAICGFHEQDMAAAAGVMSPLQRRRPKLIPRRCPQCPKYLHPKLAKKAADCQAYWPTETSPVHSSPPMVRVARDVCWAAWLISKDRVSEAVLRETLPKRELERVRDILRTVYSRLATGRREQRRRIYADHGGEVCAMGVCARATAPREAISSVSARSLEDDEGCGAHMVCEQLLLKMSGLLQG